MILPTTRVPLRLLASASAHSRAAAAETTSRCLLSPSESSEASSSSSSIGIATDTRIFSSFHRRSFSSWYSRSFRAHVPSLVGGLTVWGDGTIVWMLNRPFTRRSSSALSAALSRMRRARARSASCTRRVFSRLASSMRSSRSGSSKRTDASPAPVTTGAPAMSFGTVRREPCRSIHLSAGERGIEPETFGSPSARASSADANPSAGGRPSVAMRRRATAGGSSVGRNGSSVGQNGSSVVFVVSVRPAPLGLFASIAAAARAARSSTRPKTWPPLSSAASVPSSGSSNESSSEGPGFDTARGLFLPPRRVRTRSLACASRTRRSRRDTAASNVILASSFFSPPSSSSSSSFRGSVLDRSASGAGIRFRFDRAASSFGAAFAAFAGDRSGDPRTSSRSPDASTHSAIVRALRPPGLAAWNAAGSTACDHPPTPSPPPPRVDAYVGSTRAESPRRSVLDAARSSSAGSAAILRKDSRSGMVTPSIPASWSTTPPPSPPRGLGCGGTCTASTSTAPAPPFVSFSSSSRSISRRATARANMSVNAAFVASPAALLLLRLLFSFAGSSPLTIAASAIFHLFTGFGASTFATDASFSPGRSETTSGGVSPGGDSPGGVDSARTGGGGARLVRIGDDIFVGDFFVAFALAPGSSSSPASPVSFLATSRASSSSP